MTAERATGSPYYLSYEYDLAGSLWKIAFPSGKQITYGLDGAGRTNSVTRPAGLTTKTYAAVNTYADHGSPTKITLGNGLEIGAFTFTYNAEELMRTSTARGGKFVAASLTSISHPG